jgi:hypothetical protein
MLARMNPDPASPNSPAAMPLPDMQKLVFVLGNFSRWRMLGELADGETRTIRELAGAGGCSYDAAIKHLGLMRDLGLVVQGRGSLYQLPAHFLPVPGRRHVDFGHCLIRFDAGK